MVDTVISISNSILADYGEKLQIPEDPTYLNPFLTKYN
jgi:hypothetical protein